MTWRIVIISMLLFGFITTVNCHAEPAKTLTLKDAIFIALRYNPDIQSEEFNRILDKFNVRVQQNAFEFQYSVGGTLSTTRSVSNQTLSHAQSYNLTPGVSILTHNGATASLQMSNQSDGNYYNPELTFTVTQPLLRGFRSSVVMAPLYNAIDQEIIGRLQLRNTLITTITQVITSYRNLIGQENNLLIQIETLRRAQLTVKNTITQIKAGTVARSDLSQAQLTLENAKLAVVQARNAISQAKQQLLLTIGLDPTTKVRIPKKVKIQYVKLPPMAKSIQIALKNDPTYQSDLLQLKIDKRNLNVSIDQNRWQLDAQYQSTFGGGSGGFPNNNLNSLFNGTNNSQQFMLTLNIPINDYQLKQQALESKITLENQKIQTDLSKRQVVTNVINAVRDVKTSELAIRIAIRAEHYAAVTLKNAYKKYTYGKETTLAVTQQQVALTQAEVNVIVAQINYLNSVTRYRQVLQLTLDHWHIRIRH